MMRREVRRFSVPLNRADDKKESGRLDRITEISIIIVVRSSVSKGVVNRRLRRLILIVWALTYYLSISLLNFY